MVEKPVNTGAAHHSQVMRWLAIIDFERGVAVPRSGPRPSVCNQRSDPDGRAASLAADGGVDRLEASVGVTRHATIAKILVRAIGNERYRACMEVIARKR